MKIIDVKTHFLKSRISEPIAHGGAIHEFRHVGLTEIATEGGIVGWGEGLSCPSRRVVEQHLLGKDARDIQSIWQSIAGLGGSAFGFLSGIDIALHDIGAKARQEPICGFLGDQKRTEVRAYASGLYRKPRTDNRYLIQEARNHVDYGFRDIKMKVGFDKDDDVRLVAAVREEVGESVSLAIDANCGYSVDDAIAVGKALEEYRISYFEEPIPSGNVDGHRQIKDQISIPLAGGELLRGAESFVPLIQSRGLDIVQPDISICGGFTEFAKITALAQEQELLVMPHMWGGIIRLAATLHMLAVLPASRSGDVELMLEYDMTENPFRTELSPTRFPAVGGVVQIPSSAGVGVEMVAEQIARFAV